MLSIFHGLRFIIPPLRTEAYILISPFVCAVMSFSEPSQPAFYVLSLSLSRYPELRNMHKCQLYTFRVPTLAAPPTPSTEKHAYLSTKSEASLLILFAIAPVTGSEGSQ